MDNERGKILILVEGEKIDVRLMKHLLNIYGLSKKHRVVSYKTNIYALYNSMFRDKRPEDIDLLQLLKERESDVEAKSLFDEFYSDVLLIFDLDPQDDQYAEEKIIEMTKYFTESSDMGKLYLNYPMVEAFYHMKSIPDPAFNTYTVSAVELVNKTYKSRVNSENRNRNYSKFATNRDECNTVIKQNIDKSWTVAEKEPDENSESMIPDSMDILIKQIRRLKEQNELLVLCTCAFYIIDYNPELIEKV